MRIGIFDSGVGGRAVAEKLTELLPDAEIISVDDHNHVPYGTRTNDDIINLTDRAIQPLFKAKCDAIVIACNTATTVAISTLRDRYPATQFIGIEPMVKPAVALSTSHTVAVLATPSTLASERYNELKRTWAGTTRIIEPDCSTWAELIESNKSSRIDIERVVSTLLEDDVDVIVLACTHYHIIKERVVDAAHDGVTVLEPTDAIANRIKSLLV